MKIRLSAKLMAELKRATIHYRMPDYATVCAKALYATWRNNPNLQKIKLEPTSGGEALRVDIDEIQWLQHGHLVRPRRRAAVLRRALTWYLARLDYRPQPRQAAGGDVPTEIFILIEDGEEID